MKLWSRSRFSRQHVMLVLLFVILIMQFRSEYQEAAMKQNSPEKTIRSANDQQAKNGTFLIPDDTTLQEMREDELYLLFWRYTNTFQMLCRNTMRFGPLNGYGKDVCIDEEFVPHKPCLVYSLGSKLNFVFEEAVLSAYGCEVHTFDPSIKMNDENRQKIPDGVTYHDIGIDGRNFVNKRGWTMRTLQTIIEDLHHTNRVIDFLKMDVEGGEWSGFQNRSDFKALDNAKQLLVEFHFGRTPNSFWGGVSIVNQLKVLRTLYEKGFRICMRLPAGWLAKKIKSPYGPVVGTLTELSLLNLKWARAQ